MEKQVGTVHWSREEVESTGLVQGDDVRKVLEHLSALYFQQHGKQPTVDDIKVWDLCLRSMRVDCTERKMLGDGQYHQVVKLSGLLLTTHRKARQELDGRPARGASNGRVTASVASSPSKLTVQEARPKRIKCAVGDCDGTPRYTDPHEVLLRGIRAARVCRRHMGSHHVNVRACIRCEQPGCIKLALFGSPNDHVKARCSSHQLAKDVRLQPTPMCAATGEAGHACQRRPIYGERGRRARHCSLHRLDGEEDVVHKHCESAACGKQASFGDAWECSPRFCFQHKLSEHIRARGNGYTRRRTRKAGVSAAENEVGSLVRPECAGRGFAAVPRPAATRRRCTLDERLVLRIYGSRPEVAGGKYGRMSALSAACGVSRKTIWDIWNRRSWVKTTRSLWSAAETLAYQRSCRQHKRRTRTGCTRAVKQAEAIGGGGGVAGKGAALGQIHHGSPEVFPTRGPEATGCREGELPLGLPAPCDARGDRHREAHVCAGLAALCEGWACAAARAPVSCTALAPSAPLVLSPQPMWFERDGVEVGRGGGEGGEWEARCEDPPMPALNLEAAVDKAGLAAS